MPSYFVDGAGGGIEQVLDNLLPRRREPWALFGPDDSMIVMFTTGILPVVTTTYGRDPYVSYSIKYDGSVQADVHGDGLDDKVLVLRILRQIRQTCGGAVMDEDGRVIA